MKLPYDAFENNSIMQQAGDLIAKKYASLIVEDQYNRENGIIIEPDTTGVDFYFLQDFMTDEMYVDFPVIEQDFMAHCGSRLKEFDDVCWYDQTYIGISRPVDVMYSNVLRLIFNGAKLGDSYCLELIKSLYKTYYKKEYRTFKKFDVFAPEDILCITEDDEISMNRDYAIARVMCMALFFNKKLSDDCALWYKIFDMKREEFYKLVDLAINRIDVKEETMEEAARQIDEWNEKSLKDESTIQTYKDIIEFSNACFHIAGYQDDYDKTCMTMFQGGRLHLIITLSILKTLHPKRKYTFEEVQVCTRIRDLIVALTDTAHDFDYETSYLLGTDLDEADLKEVVFKPLTNIAENKSTKPKELVNTAPVSCGNASNEDYLKEIAELRNKLNKAEQDIQYLRSNNKKAKTEAATFESLKNQLEAEHEELIHLRNYVYNLTDETVPESNTNVEQLKKAIEDKNILIIGGHPNWHNKLKTLFPNWSFIGVEKFASLNPATADGRDKVYFFSNFIGHSEYYRFTSYMQKHDINYGYLKDTNTDSNIKQIFEELK
ncbi:hypothetical protein [Pseudobutyrivibrio ruminis]|uniref:hypothetical protein n=1 Tax=Pseudobutyrivibrio ruminis TaxID=46206 RepID=UPI00051AE8AD|nr:hypothetical protein [Pseudobutyrivibrio ruminis]